MVLIWASFVRVSQMKNIYRILVVNNEASREYKKRKKEKKAEAKYY